MNNLFNKNITVVLLILFVLISIEPGFGQSTQNTKQNPPERSQSISAEQTSQIKKILSGYNASKLTAEEAREIMNKFREAGIHAGPETNNAITAAGFDPEKLRKLAPPPKAAQPTSASGSKIN